MPTDRPVLSGRALDVLRNVVRFGVVADDQIARRYTDGDPRAAAIELQRLSAGGYLVRHPKWIVDAVLYMPTTRAARAVDLDLRPAMVKLAQLQHDLAVGDLSDCLLSQTHDAEWLTERELRRYGLDLVRGPMSIRSSHGETGVPDGVLVCSGSYVAIELERTAKARERYDGIFRRYAAATQFDRVRWFAVTNAIESRLRDLVQRYGIDDFVSVEPLPACVRIRPWAA